MRRQPHLSQLNMLGKLKFELCFCFIYFHLSDSLKYRKRCLSSSSQMFSADAGQTSRYIPFFNGNLSFAGTRGSYFISNFQSHLFIYDHDCPNFSLFLTSKKRKHPLKQPAVIHLGSACSSDKGKHPFVTQFISRKKKKSSYQPFGSLGSQFFSQHCFITQCPVLLISQGHSCLQLLLLSGLIVLGLS